MFTYTAAINATLLPESPFSKGGIKGGLKDAESQRGCEILGLCALRS